MSTTPPGLPDIVLANEQDSTVAIVTIRHVGSDIVNTSTPYRKVIRNNSINGPNDIEVHVLLSRNVKEPPYTFGRVINFTQAKTVDVRIPGKKAAGKQLILNADLKTNFWYLQSYSEIVCTVNNIPLQKHRRTKKQGQKVEIVPNPQMTYLDQTRPVFIVIRNVELTLWILKSPVEAVGPGTSLRVPPVLESMQDGVHDVYHRSELWAQHDRYILGPRPYRISRNSVKALDRFSGGVTTVKIFPSAGNTGNRRDEEFLMFGKAMVDESIVKYLQATEIDNTPAVVTETHEGFISYGELFEAIVSMHPALRFRIAGQIYRRLISALNFLHFHRIVHGQVSRGSVLLQPNCLDEGRLENMLLVDYSSAWSFGPGDESPRSSMVEDARMAMTLVEECCDIWSLRSGRAPNAWPHHLMVKAASKVVEDHDKVLRVYNHFLKAEKGDIMSKRGKELSRLLEMKKWEEHHARNEMEYNKTQRVICAVDRGKLQTVMNEWAFNHTMSSNSFPYMILSLGHHSLDSLIDHLYRGDWDLTPRELSMQLKALEGNCKCPWSTIQISRMFRFSISAIETVAAPTRELFNNDRCDYISEHSLVNYLTHIIRLYPATTSSVKEAYRKCIQSSHGYCPVNRVKDMLKDLSSNANIPETLLLTLERIANSNSGKDLRIKSSIPISYHAPSRMFNLAQLQRLADPLDLRNCITSNAVLCENFSEVRGEPDLQGHYAPLSLLSSFAEVFHLKIDGQFSEMDNTSPRDGPSDFSHINPHGRIILAHRHLVGYASMCRTADQVFHCPTGVADYDIVRTFLPTYFGDMLVLPAHEKGSFNFPRASHWSKFRAATAEPRKILVPRRTVSPSSQSKPKPTTASDTLLDRVFEEEQRMVEEAVPPLPKRPQSSPDGDISETQSKKRRVLPTLDSSPRGAATTEVDSPTSGSQSPASQTTEIDVGEMTEGDKEDVDDMLAALSVSSDAEGSRTGVTGYHIDGVDTGADHEENGRRNIPSNSGAVPSKAKDKGKDQALPLDEAGPAQKEQTFQHKGILSVFARAHQLQNSNHSFANTEPAEWDDTGTS